MLEISNTKVREWKGAPLAVVILLAISPLPLSQRGLMRASGYSDKSIQLACEYLQESGVLGCSSAGWFLLAGFQLPLEARPACAAPPALAEPAAPPQAPVDAGESRKISDPALSSSSSLKAFKDLKNLRSTTTKDLPEKNEVWQELYRLGLRRNARTKAMAAAEHVCLDYVRALAAKLDTQGRGGAKNSGLFILACEAAEQVDQSYYRKVEMEDRLFKRGRWAVTEDDEQDTEFDEEQDDQEAD